MSTPTAGREDEAEDGGDERSRRAAVRWLALGAAAGLALAAGSLILDRGDDGRDLPDDAVARVNDALIRRDVYRRLLEGLERDTRGPLDDARRLHVLDRMIDEELLVQRALEMGLAQLDRKVRAELTSSLITSVVASVEDETPSDDELEAFYRENRGFFSNPGRLRVRQIFFRVPSVDAEPSARARAEEALARLEAGEPFGSVREALGDDEISPVPDALLPPAKLREYLGPTVLELVQGLEAGNGRELVRSGTGFHVIELVDRSEPLRPDLDAIRDQVETEWRRRAGERALRAYLDELRDRAHVVTTSELP